MDAKHLELFSVQHLDSLHASARELARQYVDEHLDKSESGRITQDGGALALKLVTVKDVVHVMMQKALVLEPRVTAALQLLARQQVPACTPSPRFTSSLFTDPHPTGR